MRPCLLLLTVCSFVALAEPAVLLFPTIGTPEQVTLAGRVLKHAPSRGTSTFGKNLRRLTSSNWEGAAVEVRFADRALETTTGHDGNFSVTFRAEGKPFVVGLGNAEAKVKGAVGAATVDVIAAAAPYFVVSDFDDTLAVTNVLDGQKLVQAALLEDELTQPPVPGMADFYGCLKEAAPARPAFALVSGSPAQYLNRVRAFLNGHGFPVFGLYLRDFGPSTLRDYKQPVIRALLQAIPNPVVLVGDSGEHDPEVYRQLRAEFPERVKAIYIRNAGKAADPKRFEGMTLFSEPKDAALDAVKLGLVSAACVKRAFPSKESP